MLSGCQTNFVHINLDSKLNRAVTHYELCISISMKAFKRAIKMVLSHHVFMRDLRNK